MSIHAPVKATSPPIVLLITMSSSADHDMMLTPQSL